MYLLNLCLNYKALRINTFTLLLFLILSLPGHVRAQSENNFKPGYLVTATNDTLPGYILLDKQAKLNNTVGFKAALTDTKVQVFEPVHVNSFVILETPNPDGKLKSQPGLSSKLLLPEAGTLNLNNISIQNKLVYTAKEVTINNQEKRLFLREVITGPVSLYQAYDEHKKEQYYIQKGTAGLNALLDINYLGMLKIVLNDCPGLVFDQKESREKYKLNLQSLTQVVATYNACTNPLASITYNQLNKSSHIKWAGGIKAGVGSSQVRYTTAVSAELAQSPSRNNKEVYTPTTGFSGGAFTQLNLSGPISLQSELLFRQKGGTVDKEIYTGTPTRYRDFDHRTFLLTYLQLPILVQYQVNLPFRPYLAAGILYGKELSRKTTVDYYRESETRPRTELPDPKEINFNTAELGGILGAGCQIPITPKNKLMVEFRYEITRLPKYSVGVLNVNSWQLQTGITVF